MRVHPLLSSYHDHPLNPLPCRGGTLSRHPLNLLSLSWGHLPSYEASIACSPFFLKPVADAGRHRLLGVRSTVSGLCGPSHYRKSPIHFIALPSLPKDVDTMLSAAPGSLRAGEGSGGLKGGRGRDASQGSGDYTNSRPGSRVNPPPL